MCVCFSPCFVVVVVVDPPERNPQCSWRKQGNDSSLITFTCAWEGGYPAPTLQWEDLASKGAVLNSSTGELVEVMLNRSVLSDGQELKCEGKHVAWSGADRFCHFVLSKPRDSQDATVS